MFELIMRRDYKTSGMAKTALIVVLSLIGALGILLFGTNGFSTFSVVVLVSSFVALPIFVRMYKQVIPVLADKRLTGFAGWFSLLFALFLVAGAVLDGPSNLASPLFALSVISLSFSTFPCAAFIMAFAGTAAHASKPRLLNRVFALCFVTVVICWLLGWLAAFPGAYVQDAPFWYLEFDDPSIGISSQWSPVYAGLFYTFTSCANDFLGWRGYGLAVFTALQMLLLLYSAFKVMRFTGNECGDVACILVALFYTLVPTHMIMAVSTLQGAPYMACIAMVTLHFARMALYGDVYWANIRNPLACVGWCVLGGIVRNNMLFALLAVCILLPLFKSWRKQIGAILVASVIGISLYSGPVLDATGVVKGSSTREMASLPLQQLAYVYNYCPDKLNQEQRDKLLSFVTKDGLESYRTFPSISDALKASFDVKSFKANRLRFCSLYLEVGMRAPLEYLKAFYLQDLGLLYLGKAYPDPRIWHHYLNYAGYGQEITMLNQGYIVIERHSLFPAYDELLKDLFGHDPSGIDNSEGDSPAFSSIPLFASACRVSTYFWILVFLSFFGFFRKWRIEFLPLGLLLGVSATVLLAPLILYRYYAAVVFSIPVLLVMVFRTHRKTDSSLFLANSKASSR